MLGQTMTGLALGLGLGTLFFGGLWMTVKRLPATRHPRLMALGSYGLRMAVASGGFLLAGHVGGLCLAASCAAFLGVRLTLQLKLAPWKTTRGGAEA